MVLIDITAISWQLKVFVSLENETMEDLLCLSGGAHPASAFKPSSETRAGAAEAELKGVLSAENGLDITIVEPQAVRTKLYDRRHSVTPHVQGDPWTDVCVAVGWMTDGLKFVCFSERLGYRLPNEVFEMPMDRVHALFSATCCC